MHVRKTVLNEVCGSKHHSGHLPPAVLMAGIDNTWDRNLTLSVTI